MVTFRRLFLRYADDRDGNVIVDVLMDARRRRVSRVPTGGWWGRVGTRELWPFVLTDDGRMDFGSAADNPPPDAERYARIDLDDRILAVGEPFAVEYCGERWPVKLERVTDVAAL